MTQDRDILYLVDGSSYIYRAYHAIRHLSNSKGFPTNAIFGFCKMILKLFDEKNPEYIAIAFDTKEPTFRHELYEAYKATRPPMPEDLVAQLPYIKEFVMSLNVVTLEKIGYEADDIIGTLARIGEEKEFQVVIITGDKDFRQLISPRISLWDTMKDKFTDLEAFSSDYGLAPEQTIDMMGLSGDKSDNIPGVPGVGEKTAANLIKEFGSLESVFEHIDEIKKKKLKENLVNSHEDAVLSKQLVTIDRFVPIREEIEDLKTGEPNTEDLTALFRELEFKGLWEQFAVRKEPPQGNYHLCLLKEDLLSLKEKIIQKGIVSIDTETTSKDSLHAKLVGISFSCEEQIAHYLPIAHQYLGVPAQLDWTVILQIIGDILEDEKILKIGQNIKYDAEVLARHGVDLKGIYFDTMIASYVINPGLRQHNLDNLSQHYLNHKMIPFDEVVGKGKKGGDFSGVQVEKAMAYSCEDADMTLRLMRILDKELRSVHNETLFYDIEMKLLPVLMDMEMTGIKIDKAFFKKMFLQMSDQISQIEMEIFKEAGMEFNINSPHQLGTVLFEKLQLPGQKKTAKTKKYSTDVNVLKKLAAYPHKIPKLALRYRTLSKLKSTYLDALIKLADPTTGRVHTSYNQTVAATGRLSSSNPNLQNIPIRGEEGREIRKGFVAKEGFFLMSADYSQVELRIFAHYSGDEAFIDAFQQNEDIHARTASEIMDMDIHDVTPEMRRIAKAINFGIIYGMGAYKLSDELEIDHKSAKKYIDTYYQRYSGVERYRDSILETAKEQGYVSTLFNRRRYLPNIHHGRQRIRAEAERMAINTPIQGTAADIIKKAMINIHNRIKRERFKSKMLLQVHDELVFEVPENELDDLRALVKEEMEGVHELKVPLVVDIHVGKNWDEAH
jgi:DNA polymerase-1